MLVTLLSDCDDCDFISFECKFKWRVAVRGLPSRFRLSQNGIALWSHYVRERASRRYNAEKAQGVPANVKTDTHTQVEVQ